MAGHWKFSLLGIGVAVMAASFGCNHNPDTRLLSVDENVREGRPSDVSSIPAGQADGDSQQPELDPRLQKTNLLFARARFLETGNDVDQANKIYQMIVQSDARHAAALHRLAVLNAQRGQLTQADEYFQSALEAEDHPSLKKRNLRAQLHSDYGYFCYLSNKWGDAEHHLSRAIALDASLLEAHNNLGVLQARLGNDEKAKHHFAAAGCSAAESLTNIAFAKMLQEKFDDAHATYRLALETDPNSSKAKTGLNVSARLARGKQLTEDPSRDDGVVQAGHTSSVD